MVTFHKKFKKYNEINKINRQQNGLGTIKKLKIIHPPPFWDRIKLQMNLRYHFNVNNVFTCGYLGVSYMDQTLHCEVHRTLLCKSQFRYYYPRSLTS